jgi:hypothetical protein
MKALKHKYNAIDSSIAFLQIQYATSLPLVNVDRDNQSIHSQPLCLSTFIKTTSR